MTAIVAKPLVYTVAATQGGHAIQRNSTPLKTSAGAALVVPSLALAEAMADEMRAQKVRIEFTKMPLTQLAMTSIDLVTKERDKIAAQTAAYAESELLCHRADPEDALAAEQQKTWQPVLDWCAERFDAPLRTAAGILPIAQSPASLEALRHAVKACDNFRLAGLREAAGVTGSLVLALALTERHLDAEQVFHAAELDASHQMKKWGDDPAALARRENIRRDLDVCQIWFALLAGS
ncbi:MAG TPA: ATP12 family protein [Alphaproteobacteria bacterium]|nr:ATP12 family protein [Alphaproteobacteria bacterium]